jgi:hypothetical protein
VFTGTRGRQLAGRCELTCTGAFPYRDEWAQLIAALEATLRLHRHEPGTLPAQARYLHQRTGGMIGSLTYLIRGAAIRAILDGQEAITRPLLDSVRIDHAAESATRVPAAPSDPQPGPAGPLRRLGPHAAAAARCPAPSPRSPASTTWTTSADSPTPTTWNSWNSPAPWTTPPRSSWTPPAANSTGRNASPPRPASRWPGSPGSAGTTPASTCATPTVRPAAAPGLPPLHRPPRHQRAHRLPPAAAPGRLPPPPALDRPLRPHPRRPARRRLVPRDPQGAAPPPRPAAPPPVAGCRGHHQRRHPGHLPGPPRRHLDPGPTAAPAPARPATWEQALADVLSGRPGRPDDGPGQAIVEIAIYPDVVWLAACSLREYSATP